MFNPKGVTGDSPGQRPGFLMALLSQGVALGYFIMPRWGGRPVLLATRG